MSSNFISAIFPSSLISALRFLFSLLIFCCVSSIRCVRSSICFCIASNVEAVLMVSILSFLIELIESELLLLFELETLEKLGFLAR